MSHIGVAVIEPVGGHGGVHFYDLSLCRSIVKASADATLFTCDETPVTGKEGFEVRLPYRGIYGQSAAWLRGLRYLLGSLRALPGARVGGHRVGNLHFMPWQSPGQIYSRALVTMVSSRWAEAFGRVIVESQSLGILPVVASARGGIPEVITDPTMLVDDIEDPQPWVDRLNTLFSNHVVLLGSAA